MKTETTHRLGHYGVRFSVTTLTILPADRPRLRELYLCKAVAHYKLDTHHAGDVIVAVYARVNGGIGPQSTSSSFLIKAMGGIQ